MIAVPSLRKALQTYASPIHNFVLCALELCFRDQFRQYMRDMMVIQAAEYFVTADSVSQISASTSPRIFPRLRRILSWFRRPQAAYISLPDDQGLEMGTSLAGSTGPLCWLLNRPEFNENIIHWSQMLSDSHTGKSLWITTRKKEHRAELACRVSESLSSTDSDSKHETSLVDHLLSTERRSEGNPLSRSRIIFDPFPYDRLPSETVVGGRFRHGWMASGIPRHLSTNFWVSHWKKC
ncbi:hypothetical protein B0H14DRAFT_112953 [Mycena olivaceomarginata]|nr:hypothetical protein B0H14DRAFT_112953 [Mycena olivaceomarginata]